MRKPVSFPALPVIALVAGLSACGGDAPVPDLPDPPPPPNPPAANQPPVITVKPGNSETFELLAVSLGVEASDPDGDELAFSWKQTAGTPVDLAGADQPAFSFIAPKVVGSETLSFEVSVDDGHNDVVRKTIDLLVNEGESVVMLASLAQPNAVEPWRKHTVDSAPVHLDVPAPVLAEGEVIRVGETIRISPDRKHVAWLSDRDLNDAYELIVAPLDGSGARSLTPATTPGNEVDKFAWSPDGTRLAFVHDLPDKGDALFVVPVDSLDGSDARNITGEITHADGNPDNGGFDAQIWDVLWSPDSSSILFRGRVVDNQNRLFVVPADSLDGSDRRTISSSDSNHPAWSPDGTSIVFLDDEDDDNNKTLWIVPSDTADGSDRTELLTAANVIVSNASVNAPVFSPDGTLIAIGGRPAGDPGQNELFLLSSDGSTLRRVSGDNVGLGNFSEFAWSPDGQSLAFSGTVVGKTNEELFVVDRDSVDGNDRRKVSGQLQDFDSDTEFDGDVSHFHWSPDGKLLAFVIINFANVDSSDVFLVNADGDGSDRRKVSGASAELDATPGPDSDFSQIRWSPSGHLYFTGDVQREREYELFVVPANSADGNDRVSVSGPISVEGGKVIAYDVGSRAR